MSADTIVTATTTAEAAPKAPTNGTPGHVQPQNRDDDRRARDDDGRPGRRSGATRGGLDGGAVLEELQMACDQEEPVVDGNTESEQGRHGRRRRRELRSSGQQSHHRQSGADAEHRSNQRDTRGHHGPEHDEEQDESEGQPDQLRRTVVRLIWRSRLLPRRTRRSAQQSAQVRPPRRAGPGRPGRGTPGRRRRRPAPWRWSRPWRRWSADSDRAGQWRRRRAGACRRPSSTSRSAWTGSESDPFVAWNTICPA